MAGILQQPIQHPSQFGQQAPLFANHSRLHASEAIDVIHYFELLIIYLVVVEEVSASAPLLLESPLLMLLLKSCSLLLLLLPDLLLE